MRPRLIVVIFGTRYAATAIDPGEFGTEAIRLRKQDGDMAVYDVIRTHDGLLECSCPSWVMQHANKPTTCKHGRALAAAKLIDPPTPIPTERRCERAEDHHGSHRLHGRAAGHQPWRPERLPV